MQRAWTRDLIELVERLNIVIDLSNCVTTVIFLRDNGNVFLLEIGFISLNRKQHENSKR